MPTYEAISGTGTIPADRPFARKLLFEMVSLEQAPERATVELYLKHSRTADLQVYLVAPDGTALTLHRRTGGAVDGAMVFNVQLDSRARYNGSWRLAIEDVKRGDGGVIHGARLKFEVPRGFTIKTITSGLSTGQLATLNRVVDDIEHEIVGVRGVSQWALTIEASGVQIDGPGAVLGQAGPTRVSSSNLLPLEGIMEFDAADLQQMEADDSLYAVLRHEIHHILGIGTLWELHKVVSGYVYRGAAALNEYRSLAGNVATRIPLEDTGGPGTAGGHWKEGLFGRELMTGWLNAGLNPLSRMTIAALSDLGWVVNLDAADAFSLSARGLMAPGVGPKRPCRMARAPKVEIV